MQNNINIGDNIRFFRKKRGYTQEQLAEKSSLSLNFISAVERGTKGITFNKLLQIASALNVPLTTLVAPQTKTEKIHYIEELEHELQQLSSTDQKRLVQSFITISKTVHRNDHEDQTK